MSRYYVFLVVVLATLVSAYLTLEVHFHFIWLFVVFGVLTIIGVHDVIQRGHSVQRNYPIIGHIRWMLEEIRPELRQYFFSDDIEEMPFNRVQRSLVYQRAKGDEDKVPFGTKEDVYGEGYEWLNHSIQPTEVEEDACRLIIGGMDCTKSYSSSVLNISAMSYGALSSNAIRALNRGAKMGGFSHDTGEGSISKYHRMEGGDLVWELGTAYYGCRTEDGKFDPVRFKEQAADDQVKMIEIKMSQGAKPGHGGILPAGKVTKEISEARGIPMGEDSISPPSHSAFSDPIGLMNWIAELRELSGGKPIGFKLCIGHKWEFMAIVKAMVETGIRPDFIVIDGSEGGTGAAPQEYAAHIGTPLIEGLTFAHNTLVGAGVRYDIKLGASGKVVSAFDMVRLLSLGADYCNAGRAFMMSLGCIQSLTCHTNNCPTGVATQDPVRTMALDVDRKSVRVANFHKNTLKHLREILSTAGVYGPKGLKHHHFNMRDGDGIAHGGEELGPWLANGELLEGTAHEVYARAWGMAQASSFRPQSLQSTKPNG